jgi:two-component system chemotaxis response regulator CheB
MWLLSEAVCSEMCHTGFVVSGSGHKQEESKVATLLARVRQARLAFVEQREILATLRDSIGLPGVKLTESATLADRQEAHEPRRPDAPTASAVVAFAVSAGGLAPLITVVSALPLDCQAAVVIAQHSGSCSALPRLLQGRCRLPVKFAANGEAILRGTVYVAPPMQHLIVNANHTFSLVPKARVRFARPSADWLFETIAATYAECAVGIVLSGYQCDGARGVVLVHDRGGVTIVQDPATAAANEMPNAAIGTGSVSRVLRPELIADAIMQRLNTLDLDRIGRDFENPFAATA